MFIYYLFIKIYLFIVNIKTVIFVIVTLLILTWFLQVCALYDAALSEGDSNDRSKLKSALILLFRTD
jgi:hypothetical protein